MEQPNQGDWNKLLRIIKYIVGIQELCLTLNADKTSFLKWFVDAEFTVHPDFKSNTGATLRMTKLAIIYVS